MSDVLAEAIVRITCDKSQVDAGMHSIRSQIAYMKTESRALMMVGHSLVGVSHALRNFIVLPGLALAGLGVRAFFKSGLAGAAEMRVAWMHMERSIVLFLQRVGAVVNQGGRLTKVFNDISKILDRISPKLINSLLNVVKWAAVLMVISKMLGMVMLMTARLEKFASIMMKLGAMQVATGFASGAAQGGGGLVSNLLGGAAGGAAGGATTKVAGKLWTNRNHLPGPMSQYSSQQILLNKAQGPGYGAAARGAGEAGSVGLLSKLGAAFSKMLPFLTKLTIVLSIVTVAWKALTNAFPNLGIMNSLIWVFDLLAKVLETLGAVVGTVFNALATGVNMLADIMGRVANFLYESAKNLLTLDLKGLWGEIKGLGPGIAEDYRAELNKFRDDTKESFSGIWGEQKKQPGTGGTAFSGQTFAFSDYAKHSQEVAAGKGGMLDTMKAGNATLKRIEENTKKSNSGKGEKPTKGKPLYKK